MHNHLKMITPAVVFALGMSGPARAEGHDMPRLMTVTGEGMATVVPDLAWVTLGVSHDAPKAGDAMAQMSQDMAAVLAVLAGAGIAPVDIQTGQLTLEPRMDYSSSDGVAKMLGYTATTLVEVRVRALADLGSVLDAVVQDGANRLGGIRFDVSDKEPILQAARRDAVADARARAELYADAAGFVLGDLVSLSEAGGFGPPMPMYDMRGGMLMEAAVPIAAGEVNWQASVTMVWEIE